MTGTKKCANFGGKWVRPPQTPWYQHGNPAPTKVTWHNVELQAVDWLRPFSRQDINPSNMETNESDGHSIAKEAC